MSLFFLAGFTGILGRLITINEGMIVWYRLLLTAVTMWILFGVFKKVKKILIADIIKISLVGFIATLHWVTFYGSIKYSNVSVALVCFAAISFFTALFEPIILKKKLNWVEFFLGIFTLIGIYIIFHFDAKYKTGIILGILSAILASLFPIFNREFLKRMNVETMLTWQQTGGFVLLSMLLPFYLQKFPVNSFIPSFENLAWLLVLAWFLLSVGL
jgi:drug/metabolite transporter (DMT)-like permease